MSSRPRNENKSPLVIMGPEKRRKRRRLLTRKLKASRRREQSHVFAVGIIVDPAGNRRFIGMRQSQRYRPERVARLKKRGFKVLAFKTGGAWVKRRRSMEKVA